VQAKNLVECQRLQHWRQRFIEQQNMEWTSNRKTPGFFEEVYVGESIVTRDG